MLTTIKNSIRTIPILKNIPQKVEKSNLISKVVKKILSLSKPSDSHWNPSISQYKIHSALYKKSISTSRYLAMRDGVKIAIDLHLPKTKNQSDTFPTIIRQTRYFRSVSIKKPLSYIKFLRPLVDKLHSMRNTFLQAGYAWVDVDVRGTGASFGVNPYPWSDDEVQDGSEIIDWIISQPWSNKKVGTLGTSYEGTTAEYLATTQHPALKASAPRFASFDLYADIAFPGGIHLFWFSKRWGELNKALDTNRLGEFFGLKARTLLEGVRKVDEDPEGLMLNEALPFHTQNYNIHQTALKVTYRDDRGISPSFYNHTIDNLSTHEKAQKIFDAKTGLYHYTGWYDGGYTHSAIKRFLNINNRGSKLIIGPWEHGGFHHCGPIGKGKESTFDHDAELLSFFDTHIKDHPDSDTDNPIHYFTLGEEKWKSAKTWPPMAKFSTFYFHQNRRLSQNSLFFEQTHEVYDIDYHANTGKNSRWNSLINMPPKPVIYNYQNNNKYRYFTLKTDPFRQSTEVTGHPMITFYISADAEDGNVFVYLEDNDNKGNIEYVTEGLLRLIHRKLSDNAPYRQIPPYRSFKKTDASSVVPGEVMEITIDLLPISYQFKKGHSLQISIAGADSEHFAHPKIKPSRYTFYFGKRYPSKIELPIIE